MRYFNLLSLVIFVLVMNISIFAQEYGKIFTSTEADSLFGPVLTKHVMEKDALNSSLQKTEKVIMFRIENNDLIILGDERTVLYTTNAYTDKNEVFSTFSKSKVLELEQAGNKAVYLIEQRKEHLTITNGDYTLEVSIPCPPYCD